MSDVKESLVGRLIKESGWAGVHGPLMEKAANEILRLTAELEAVRDALEAVRDALEALPPGILGEASEVETASDGEVGVRSWTIRDELIDRVSRALRSEAQGELVKEAVALIDEAVSEVAGDCQCYEEDGEVVLCWTCRAVNWSDRAGY